jgi:hypothetical protein
MQVANKLIAAALAATLCTAAHAQFPNIGASEASLISGSLVVALPFLLVSAGSEAVGQSLSNLSEHSRWQVTDLKEQPEGKTQAQMKCDDGKFNLTMTVQTPTVREQRLAVGDVLDIDRVGTAGYVVKKGPATIGVLAQPDMAHSKARS